MENSLRNSGIDVIGSVPWGTHFCQFYQTKQDLIDILVPYFKAGLENNEFCMWVTAEPLTADEARDVVTRAVPGFEQYVARGQIEIIPYSEWYLLGGTFDDDRVLNGWVSKLEQARARGYSGLRLTGNTFWLERNHWQAFTEYEAKVNNVIGQYRMLAICTYCLDRCDGAAVIDVVRNHQFALIKQAGKWDLIESAIYKQAKAALRESEERFHSLFHTMTEGFALHEIILDGSGKPCDYRFIEVNDAFNRQTGLRPENLIGRTAREVLPGLEDYWIDTYGKVALTGEVVNFENFSAPLGRWYEVYAYSPKKGYFATLLRDVTERKQAEEALRESQRDLNRAQAVAHTGSWRLDVQRNELLWSDETYRVFGIPKERPMTYEVFLSAVHPEDREYVDREWTAALQGEDYDIEHRIIVGNEVRWVRERAELEFDSEGLLKGGFGTAQDITERKKAEQLKDEFIGMVSHELKTPLTVIIGALSVATGEGIAPEQARELIQDAVSSAGALAGIVDNLLELSRYQANRLNLQAERTHIDQVAQDVIQKLKTRSTIHYLAGEFPSGLPAVIIDRTRIERVLHNLVENAIKYSPEGGSVTVFALPQDNEVIVGVSDQGIGISPEDQPNLFQSFQRIETHQKYFVAGIGLGLKVCRILVEAHGGRIWVESAPGKGSTFFFSLPVGDGRR